MPVLIKEFFEVQETIEYTFILNHIIGMIKTYSSMHHTSYNTAQSLSQFRNILVFFFELSGFGFVSYSSQLNDTQFLYYNLIEVIILLYTVLVTFLHDTKIILFNGFRLTSFEIWFLLQSERKQLAVFEVFFLHGLVNRFVCISISVHFFLFFI